MTNPTDPLVPSDVDLTDFPFMPLDVLRLRDSKLATSADGEAFPRALVEPCILAGSRPGDIVFDPFLGSGTTAQVAQQLGRHWIGCELNPDYLELQRNRTRQIGLMLDVA